MSDATRRMLGFETVEELRLVCERAGIGFDVIPVRLTAAAVTGSMISSIHTGRAAHPRHTAASVPAILGWTLTDLADARPDIAAVGQLQTLIAAHTVKGVAIVPVAALLPLLEKIHTAMTGEVLVARRVAHASMPPRDEGADWDSQLFEQQMRALGRRVRAARQSHRWSQQDLADRTAIGRPSLSGIEGGKQNITLEVLWRLASALQLHWADLLDDREADIPGPQAESAPFNEQLRAFGTRVYETRVLQRLSQRALTARTAIDRSGISLIELGTQNATLETLSRLAVGLQVHWADLLDDRTANHPHPAPGQRSGHASEEHQDRPQDSDPTGQNDPHPSVDTPRPTTRRRPERLLAQTRSGHRLRLPPGTVDVWRALLDLDQPVPVTQLARRSGRSIPTVQAALNRLGILEWIAVSTRYEHKRGRTSYYQLNHLGRAQRTQLADQDTT